MFCNKDITNCFQIIAGAGEAPYTHNLLKWRNSFHIPEWWESSDRTISSPGLVHLVKDHILYRILCYQIEALGDNPVQGNLSSWSERGAHRQHVSRINIQGNPAYRISPDRWLHRGSELHAATRYRWRGEKVKTKKDVLDKTRPNRVRWGCKGPHDVYWGATPAKFYNGGQQ